MKSQKRKYDVEQAAGIMLFARSLELVLLICDKRGVWRFPCGRLRQGESFLETAIRTFLRETRIDRGAFSIVECPVPVISSRRSNDSPGRDSASAKLRFLFPAILRTAELVNVEPVLGSTSDVAWLSLEDATVATKSPTRIAALKLGHAIAKGIPPALICESEEMSLELVPRKQSRS